MPIAPTFNPSNDTPLMREAIKFLNEHHVLFTRKTAFQLKIGSVSYYPDRGTIYVDGASKAMTETGLNELLCVVAPDHDVSRGYILMKQKRPVRPNR